MNKFIHERIDKFSKNKNLGNFFFNEISQIFRNISNFTKSFVQIFLRNWPYDASRTCRLDSFSRNSRLLSRSFEYRSINGSTSRMRGRYARTKTKENTIFANVTWFRKKIFPFFRRYVVITISFFFFSRVAPSHMSREKLSEIIFFSLSASFFSLKRVLYYCISWLLLRFRVRRRRLFLRFLRSR